MLHPPASMSDWHIYDSEDAFPEALRHHYRSTGWPVFSHPMLIQIMPVALPAPIEEVIALRQKQADGMLARGELAAYLLRHERPYRMDVLLELLDDDHFPGCAEGQPRACARFWGLAADIWTDCEADESDPIWTALMTACVPHKEFMSGIAGRRALRQLPDTIRLYRGTHAPTPELAEQLIDEGWSWSTDRSVAKKFARRYCATPDRPYIATADVPKELIQAYLLGRNESEALVAPGTVNFSMSSLTGEQD